MGEDRVVLAGEWLSKHPAPDRLRCSAWCQEKMSYVLTQTMDQSMAEIKHAQWGCSPIVCPVVRSLNNSQRSAGRAHLQIYVTEAVACTGCNGLVQGLSLLHPWCQAQRSNIHGLIRQLTHTVHHQSAPMADSEERT